MDPEAIELEIHDNTMTMRQKQAEFVLSLQDPEEFPDVKEITGSQEFSLSGATFLEMLDKVGFAISSDETRYVLTGMYVIGSEGRISVVGTDGFRMALYQQEVEGLKGFAGYYHPEEIDCWRSARWSRGRSVKVRRGRQARTVQHAFRDRRVEASGGQFSGLRECGAEE